MSSSMVTCPLRILKDQPVIVGGPEVTTDSGITIFGLTKVCGTIGV